MNMKKPRANGPGLREPRLLWIMFIYSPFMGLCDILDSVCLPLTLTLSFWDRLSGKFWLGEVRKKKLWKPSGNVWEFAWFFWIAWNWLGFVQSLDRVHPEGYSCSVLVRSADDCLGSDSQCCLSYNLNHYHGSGFLTWKAAPEGASGVFCDWLDHSTNQRNGWYRFTDRAVPSSASYGQSL